MYAVLVVLELERLAVITQVTEELQDSEICYLQPEGKEAAQIHPMRRIREVLAAQVAVDVPKSVAETEALTAEAAVAEALVLPEKVEPMAGMEVRAPQV